MRGTRDTVQSIPGVGDAFHHEHLDTGPMRPTRAQSLFLVPLVAVLGACAPASGSGPVRSFPIPPPHIYEIPLEQVAVDTVLPGVIQVQGTAEVGVQPDRAHVRFFVETRERTADRAAAANARLTDAALDALRDGGFAGLDLQTSGYRLTPVYSYPSANENRVRVIDGYTVRNTVQVTTTDVSSVGRIVDAAIAAGVNGVEHVSFTSSDTEKAEHEALALAVERARRTAEVMAASLGYALGEPVEVTGGAHPPQAPPTEFIRLRSEMAMAPETPVEVGESLVRASVSVKFRIGPTRSR
ncbi:MAG: SIMPL domain-containing protein [Gemmatimonadota bacterium]|nr:SIMPL domain-containing protein [Gemmatimonadota bacterium]MDH5758736.1 SIMPL domain-containing protein [Gemmatimonadota bacterium]